MGYIDQTDLESAITARRLGEMLDDAGTWSEGDTYSGDMDDALEYCIERASGLIDGYLRGKYTVPLDTDNLSDSSKSLIQQWTIDLTIYLLKQRRRETITEGDYTQYKDTIRQLGDIAKGLIKLDIGDTADGVTQRNGYPTSNRIEDSSDDYEPIFEIDSDGNDPLSKF